MSSSTPANPQETSQAATVSLQALYEQTRDLARQRQQARRYCNQVSDGTQQAQATLGEFKDSEANPDAIDMMDANTINLALARAPEIKQGLQQVRSQREQTDKTLRGLLEQRRKQRTKWLVIAAIILAVYLYL